MGVFFSDNEYSAFLNQIDEYFKKQNINYELQNGVVNVSENLFGFGKLGLQNLAQVCNQHDMPEYKEIVHEHFNSLVRTEKFNTEFKSIVNDFDKIKDYIGVRIYHNDYVASVGKNNIVGKDLAGDICAIVVFDLPDSIQTIKPEQIEKWGKDFECLFDLGVKNIK